METDHAKADKTIADLGGRPATFAETMAAMTPPGDLIVALYSDEGGTRLEITHPQLPNKVTVYHIQPLSDDTDRAVLAQMVQDGWEISATSIEAQQILQDAGVVGSTTMALPALPLDKGAEALQKRPGHIGLERAMNRLPVFVARSASAAPSQPSLWKPAFMEGGAFDILEANGPMGARDSLLLGHMVKRFADVGYPLSREVHFYRNDAARWSGYSKAGGQQQDLAMKALERIWGVSWRSPVTMGGKQYKLWWRAIDNLLTPEDPADPIAVRFNEVFVFQIRSGSLDHLAADTFAELVNKDEIAALLWRYLESHKFTHTWAYRLFSAPPGQPARQLDTPPIADLLRIGHWKDRGEVAKRIRKAAVVIQDTDPKYTLAVVPMKKEKQVWKLTVQASTTDPPADVLPAPGSEYYRPPKGSTTDPPPPLETPASGKDSDNPMRPTSTLQTSIQTPDPKKESGGATLSSYLRTTLERLLGEDWGQDEALVADVTQELAKVRDTIRPMVEGLSVSDSQRDKLTETALHYTLDRIPETANNPMAYLESMRQNATNLAGLVGDDGYDFIKATIRASDTRAGDCW